MKPRRVLTAAVALMTVACSERGGSDDARILLGTTHTLEDSGILDTLVAQFQAGHPGARLQVVVAGSGEIMTIARRGDVDVILTHSPVDEQAFIAASSGIERRAVMYNSFVVAGPAADPAHVAQATDAVNAFTRIRRAQQPFVSRGDQSGTHRKELAIWSAAGVRPDWNGYEEGGAGMADVLRVASQRDAYTLADIATLTVLRNTIEIVPLFTGDPLLVNEYSVITVRNARNGTGGELFADWVTSPAAKAVIARHGAPHAGQPLFTAGAPPH